MSKKIVAMLMAVAMAFSLLPVTAFAMGGPSATTTKDVVDGYYDDHNQWVKGEQTRSDELQNTVTTVNKTAEKVSGQDNQYEVTLKVEMKQKGTAVPPGAAATVLVIDTSGSMNYCTKEEHQHTDACYQWEECTPQVNPDHYRWDGGHKILNTNCKYEDGRYIYPASQTCGKEKHTHTSDTCEAPYRINAAKEAAKNFLNSYRGGTVREDGTWAPSTNPLKRYISVVWFNKGVSSREWLDVSTQAGYNTAIASINALSAKKEGTNLDAGLRMADAQLNNGTVKNIPANVVVLTDGEPTYYLKESSKKDTITIGDKKYQIKNDGKQCTQNTYDQTVSTAQSLRNSVSGGVYTVCFGASSEILSQVKGKPTVGTFLQEKVATQPEAGSTQKYAYEAQDADDLNRVFAAISSSVVSGLNTGKVTDALPTGVSCVTNGIFDQAGNLTWQLDPARATKRGPDSNGFITYTYEKTYKVQIDPVAEGLNVVNGYVPLNKPTMLTVKDSTSNRDIDIPFPIPAGKVTYSLTDFKKELVTSGEQLSFSTDGFTIPANTTDPVVVSGEGVTLLYKITVNGDKGAKFTVRDDGATLVSPTDHSIVFNQTDSTFSGTVGTGETVFYVSKQFTERDIESSSDTKTVRNTAIIAPGDNTNGLTNNEKTVTTTVTEEKPQTYTVTYQWAEGETPSDATLPNAGSPIPVNVGETHNVADNPTSNVRENKAGDSGKWTCTWDKSGAVGSTATAGSNIVITGTWKFTKDQPKTGNLIVKKVVSGEGVTLNDLPENFTITVSAGEGQEPIDLTLNGTDYIATKDNANTTATWTIPDLTPGTYTVSEENADVTGYDYTAAYASSNETDTEKSVTVTENGGTMTVTNKYTKKEVPPTPSDPVKLDVSRSKIASRLTKNSNGDWTTDVTLGLPSATTKQTIEVVLVVDNAFPTDNTTAATQAAGLMEQLEEIAKSGTVSVNAGLVISGGYIPVLHQIGLGNIENNITNIKEAIDKSKTDWKKQEGRKGSNIQAGVETARQMLAGETSASKENKYLVLISDGGAFSWYENETSVSKFYSTSTETEEKDYYWCNPWDFQMRYGDGESSREFDFTALMEKPEAEVDANSIPCPSEEWPSTGNGQNGEGTGTQYQSNYSKETVQSTLDKYPNTCAYSIVSKEGYITSREAALYHTAKSISMASNEVKVIFVSFPYYSGNLFKLTEGFKQYVADNNDNVTLYRVNGAENYPDEYKAGDSAEVFKSVKRDLIYWVDKGSKVEDTIGNKFTLIPDSFKLTVGGTELNSVKDSETYYFGDKTVSTTAYKFKVTVTKTESETKFDWDINEAITKDKPVKLTYTLKLTEPKTLAGTYGVKDLNGDGIVDGTDTTKVADGEALYTNESATMVPKDSNGNEGKKLTFPKPSVSYTIKSSSGSHSGGSRPSLNTKDHYGYIIGYPVDYYTGQPTTDQTKKPVRPEGKITRAEVATIYFRMLTDESRTKFWSQNSGYSDVKAGDWFNNAVSTLSNAGIIAGYEDGSFRPNGYITRAEFATIAARFFDVTYNGKDLFPDISGHWAKDYINQAANKGFVNGYEDGTFKPDRNITRAEAVTLVNRTLDRHPDKSHFTKDMLVWPDNMDQTKWYYADMQEATNSHTYQMKENSDKTKYENWTKTLPIRNWEALEKAWSNANSSQGNGNVV